MLLWMYELDGIFVWARLAGTDQSCTRALAQAEALVLSEARGCLAQARRARLSEPCESLPMPLSRSRLSEGPPPKRGYSSCLNEDS
ncbi:hypothetical protein DEO72_LG10g1991 [Vigna unguiculata]|uniref:Uncharacterized protein n=1 Tax=Vigna unguiculata TaxID=3917 RepID=A0A4D6NDZ1_VIGUN|nr:hypothetical protein DEO72_LG10g1990 [Vigna unguiculata]QCE10759.1 hypothetical protein DEO72_LG10g1991 [Vigna unguiculata]